MDAITRPIQRRVKQMSKYRETIEPYSVSVEDLYVLEDLINTKKLTDKQKQALKNLLKEHYSRD